MSFVHVNAKPRAINEVPSIVHVDGTCRVQTIDRGPFYDLIPNVNIQKQMCLYY